MRCGEKECCESRGCGTWNRTRTILQGPSDLLTLPVARHWLRAGWPTPFRSLLGRSLRRRYGCNEVGIVYHLLEGVV